MDINSETFKRFFFQNKRMVEKKKDVAFSFIARAMVFGKMQR